MTDRQKFLAVAAAAISAAVVYKVSPCGATLMVAMLLIVIYLAWKQLDH